MNPALVFKIIKDVVTYGPAIKVTAEEIYKHTKTIYDKIQERKTGVKEPTIKDLNERIEQLEQNALEKAKLISDMANQIDNLSKLANVLAKRILFANTITLVSLALVIYLLVR